MSRETVASRCTDASSASEDGPGKVCPAAYAWSCWLPVTLATPEAKGSWGPVEDPAAVASRIVV